MFAGANAPGKTTAIKQQWFPPLPFCTSMSGCIGYHEAVYNALADLISRLGANSTVNGGAVHRINVLGNDHNGNKLTTGGFVDYPSKKRPLFYNGMNSRYCYQTLLPTRLPCDLEIATSFGVYEQVSDYLINNSQADAATYTPSYPLLTFFRPTSTSILFQSSGQNAGTESVIFHEALHGITGDSDATMLDYLYGSGHDLDLSCKISVYIENNVFSQSLGLDQSTTSCP